MARRRDRKRRKLKIFFIFISIFLTTAAIIAGIFIYIDTTKERVRPEITIEAGSTMVEVEEFLLLEEDIGTYVSAPTQEDLNNPGSYPVIIEVDHLVNSKEYKSVIKVVDSTPPTATVKDLEIIMPTTVEADDFIESVNDTSEYTICYKSEPDFSKEGSQEVFLNIEDKYNNNLEVAANLTIIKDTTAPIIEGTQDKFVFVGDTISYRQDVVVTDDIDTDVELIIDNSQVNIQQPGEYVAVYQATDASGNTTSEEINVVVRPKVDNPADEKEVLDFADQILMEIIDPFMSELDKAWSIYSWVVRNVSYVGDSDKTDWITGAYEGFTNKKGDCFTYFSVAKTLLTRADIPNIDVTRLGGRTKHYWHLVDCGEGWYHFDTTPQRDYIQTFMLTDEEVEAYTATGNRDYYSFDKSLYPERGK